MSISLIVAHGMHNAIGKDGKIPWNLPTDMQRFKELTMGKPVIMGRKTYFTIGKPLPGRKNIVMTKQDLHIEGVEIARSMKEALEFAGGAEEIMVIGGEEIYKLFLPYAKTVYITVVEDYFEGDAFFPKIPFDEWVDTEIETHKMDEKNSHNFTFITYEKKKSGNVGIGVGDMPPSK